MSMLLVSLSLCYVHQTPSIIGSDFVASNLVNLAVTRVLHHLPKNGFLHKVVGIDVVFKVLQKSPHSLLQHNYQRSRANQGFGKQINQPLFLLLIIHDFFCYDSVHPQKRRGVLSQYPFVLWASDHQHYKRTLYSRRPLKKRDRSFYLSS